MKWPRDVSLAYKLLGNCVAPIHARIVNGWITTHWFKKARLLSKHCGMNSGSLMKVFPNWLISSSFRMKNGFGRHLRPELMIFIRLPLTVFKSPFLQSSICARTHVQTNSCCPLSLKTMVCSTCFGGGHIANPV